MAAIIKEIKVSVCMATYNHQKYIKQAIEGILMQKTDFEFELLISNDFSTDSTSQIINEIIINNPNGFRIVFYDQEYKLGMHLNGDFLLKKAQGKYIAICEGDDFWTNPNKLQIQFDYLEQNINCGLVHHDVDYFYEKENYLIKSYKKSKKIKIPGKNITENLLLNNFISTLSVMFRKEMVDMFFDIDFETRNKFLMSDYFMWLLFSSKYSFKYLDVSMATYRILENSASNSHLYEKKILFLSSYCDIKLYFINKYNFSDTYIKKIKQYKYQELSILSIRNNRLKEALEYSKKLCCNHYKKLAIKILSFLFYHLKITRKYIKYI